MSESIWVVDDDRSIRWVLEKALSQENYAVTCFEDADEALNTLENGGQEPDVLISDVRMPGTDGLRMLKILQRKNPDLPVIIMTAHSDLDSAVASYQGGAFEYLPKPFDVDEAVALVRRALKHREESRGEFPAAVEEAPTEIIGEAPAMQEVFRAIGQTLAPVDGLDLEGRKLRVTDTGRTSVAGVWAGGDCTPGEDLTVVAVAEGRDAAEDIHATLMAAAG